MFEYEAKMLRIVDGDTYWMDLDLGFHIHTEVEVRMAHINTPETVNYKATGIVDPAAVYVAQCVPPGSLCVVQISRAEKYGRWLSTILFQPGVTKREDILKNPRVLNDELVQKGFAQRYEGGKK